MSVLSKSYFHNEAAAFEYLETIVWSNGVVCSHCGTVDGRVYDLSDVRGKPSKKNPEGAIRHGLKKCGECRKQFTVKVGTVFEHARMPLHKMLQAVYLITSSKKGISAHQLGRVLEITYKSAWFLAHRIREAMRSGDLDIMGGDGEAVEVDETFIGRKKGTEVRRGTGHKMAVLSLVQRGGSVRSFTINGTSAREIGPIVNANVARETFLLSDEARQYQKIGKDYHAHLYVNHGAGEYVDGPVHTNTIEGFFSIFKRGMKGIYQHCSEKHLHRYLAEYDFRYNNRSAQGIDDKERSINALRGISGKRLTYGQSYKSK